MSSPAVNTAAARPRKPRRWRRRLAWCIAAALLGRAALALSMPWLVDYGFSFLGCTATYRSASLSLLGLSFHLDDLEVRDASRAGGPALLTAQEVTADLSTWQLLHGQIGVVDAVLSGCTLETQRGSDGELRLPPGFPRTQTAPATPVSTPPPASPTPGFELPLSIASARVNDLHLRCHDETFSPARDLEVVIDIDAADIGRRDRKGHLTVRAESPGLVDRLHLQASVMATADRLDLAWDLAIRGVHLHELPLPPSSLESFAGARLGGFELTGSLAADRTTAPDRRLSLSASAQTAVLLDDSERLRLRVTAGPASADGDAWQLPFSAELHGADLVDRLRIEAAKLEVGPDRSTIAAELACHSLTLRRLEPWLHAHGISIASAGIDAAARLKASMATGDAAGLSASLDDLQLRHGEEHIDLQRLAVENVHFSAKGIEIGGIEISGPEIRVARESNGDIAIAGVRLRHDHVATPAPTAPAPAIASGGKPPSVRLRHLDWHGASVHFSDATLADTPSLQITDLSVRGEDLGFGADLPPGHARITFRAADNLESVIADLQVRPAEGGGSVELGIDGTGVTARGLSPWLRSLGISPQLQNGNFHMGASGKVAMHDGGTTASGRIADLLLRDGDEVLLRVRNAEVADLRSDRSTLDLGTIRIDEPHLVIERRPEGSTRMLGFDFGAVADAGTSQRQRDESPPPGNAPPTSPPQSPPAGNVAMQGAVLTVRDLRANGHTTQIGLDASFRHDRGDAAPTTFATSVRFGATAATVDLRGELQQDAQGTHIAATLQGQKIAGTALVGMLPDDIVCTLADGSLQAHVTALARRAEHDTALDLAVDGLVLSDSGTELMAMDHLQLLAPALGTQRIHIENLQIDGVRAISARTAEGLHVPGLLLRVPTTTAAAPSPTAAVPQANPAGTPIAAVLPELRIDHFTAALDHLRFQDRTRVDAPALDLTAKLRLARPWTTAADLGDTPPAILALSATALPLCRDLQIEVAAAPFQLAPSLDVDMHADGIDPTSIAKVLPALADRVGGTTDHAELTAHLHCELDLRRRDVLHFDLTRPFGATVLIDKLSLRDVAANNALATVERIDMVARSIDLRTGDVFLKSIDIDSPELGARSSEAGLEVGGLLLRNPPPAPTANDAAIAPQLPPQSSGVPTSEFAVDHLRVQGLAFDFLDTTTQPVTHLPIQDLDLAVQHFSTRALHEPLPVAFRLSARGGDVELQRRLLHSSMVAGVLDSTALALTGGSKQPETERRPLFQDLVATGELQLFPLPKGECRLDLSGFELPAMRGLANRGGVKINDGLFDTSVVTSCRGASGSKIKSALTFTWLSLSEPPNGPIATYLKLPAPLDTVLFLLRNQADEQRIPFQVELPASGSVTTVIAQAAAEAVTLALGDAIGSSSMRALSAVTGLLGLTGRRDDLGKLTTTLTYGAGDVEADAAPLAALLAATADDPDVKFVLSHELSEGDMERANQLTSPSHEVLLATVSRLRERRGELLAARAPLAFSASGRFAAARHDADAALRELNAVDTELGLVEATLDTTLAMLEGNPVRAQQRAARRAAQALGERRLAAVRAYLSSRLPPDAVDRIEVRAPRAVATEGIGPGGRVIVTPRFSTTQVSPPR